MVEVTVEIGDFEEGSGLRFLTNTDNKITKFLITKKELLTMPKEVKDELDQLMAKRSTMEKSDFNKLHYKFFKEYREQLDSCSQA